MIAQAEELREHPPVDWIVKQVFSRKPSEEEADAQPSSASGVNAMMAMFPGGTVKLH